MVNYKWAGPKGFGLFFSYIDRLEPIPNDSVIIFVDTAMVVGIQEDFTFLTSSRFS